MDLKLFYDFDYTTRLLSSKVSWEMFHAEVVLLKKNELLIIKKLMYYKYYLQIPPFRVGTEAELKTQAVLLPNCKLRHTIFPPLLNSPRVGTEA